MADALPEDWELPSPPGEPGAVAGYRLGRIVGEGGFGEVWEATQDTLSRVIAVKVLREKFYHDFNEMRILQLEAGFRQEALTAAKLEHPNIVPIYDLGCDQRGRPQLAMKMVDGEPWSHSIHREFDTLPVEDFLAKHLPILIGVTHAVAYSHARGIAHRDIKPSQVMLGSFGEVLLMDWGLAYVFDAGAGVDAPLDATQHPRSPLATSPAGTPSFMAPEQTSSDLSKTGPWTDIFLLGATLYYLLTHQPPHVAEDSKGAFILARDCNIRRPSVVSPNRNIPPEIEALCLQAMARDPADRIGSAEELAARLKDYLYGATGKRESSEITESVKKILKSGREDYRIYSESLSQLRNAAKLWPRNPDIPSLESAILQKNARMALDNGDLVISRVQAERIAETEVRQRLLEAIFAQEKRANRRERQRKIALCALVVLMVGMVAGFAKYNVDQRRANSKLSEERDRANEARALAESAQAEALVQENLANEARLFAEREQYFSMIEIARSAWIGAKIEKLRDSVFERSPVAFRQWEWGFLVSQLFPEDITLQSPEQIFDSVYTPDGKYIASGGKSSLCLWDAATGQRIWAKSLSSHIIWQVSVSRDGSKILACSFDKKAYLVETATGDTIHVFDDANDLLRGGDISFDSQRVVTGGADGIARIYDAVTGKLLLTIDPPGDTIYYSQFSPDGTEVALCPIDGPFVICDVATGKIRLSIGSVANFSYSAVYTKDGKQIVSAHADDTVRRFDTASGKQLGSIPVSYAGAIHHASLSPDDKMVAVSDSVGRVRVYRLADRFNEGSVLTDDPMWHAHFSPSGEKIVVSSRRSARVLDFERAFERFELTENPTAKDFQSANVLKVFGLTPQRHSGWGALHRRWNAASGATKFSQNGDEYLVVAAYSAFDADGRLRADVSEESNRVTVTDTTTGKVLFESTEGRPYKATFSADGKYLAVGDWDTIVHVYSTDSWGPPLELALAEPSSEAHFQDKTLVSDLAFDPAGKRLAVGYFNGTVILWDIESGSALHRWSDVPGAGSCVAFSRDGKFVAAGGTDDAVGVWDTDTGLLRSRLIGHQRATISVNFSPDGERIVTSSNDGMVKVWTTDGRELLNIYKESGTNQPLGAAFTQDGRRIMVANGRRGFRVFNTFPWTEEQLEIPEDLPLVNKLELWKRRTRLGLDIPASYVTPDPDASIVAEEDLVNSNGL